MAKSLIRKNQLHPDIADLISYYGKDTFLLSKSSSFILAVPDDNLLTKYSTAKLLTPNGSALSSTNRATLIIFPGTYSLSSTWIVDAEYVDIIGLGSIKLERGCVPAVTLTTNTMNVTANDVHVKGISVGTQPFNLADNKSLQVIEDCKGGAYSFGYYNIVSGTLINCMGGIYSFCSGVGFGNAAGTFINCLGGGYCFGSEATASGIFINCTGTERAFGGGGYGGVASGTFSNCVGGDYAFGGWNAGSGGPSGTASGIFINCLGGINSFGGDGILNGKLYNCRLIASSFRTITSPGLIRNCIDGNNNLINA